MIPSRKLSHLLKAAEHIIYSRRSISSNDSDRPVVGLTQKPLGAVIC